MTASLPPLIPLGPVKIFTASLNKMKLSVFMETRSLLPEPPHLHWPNAYELGTIKKALYPRTLSDCQWIRFLCSS